MKSLKKVLATATMSIAALFGIASGNNVSAQETIPAEPEQVVLTQGMNYQIMQKNNFIDSQIGNANDKLTSLYHYSHRSHYSHGSHHSHYSHYSSSY